ncbi:MAG TPA: hypothetical protein VGH05_09935 [Buttiauxella sp.]
MPTIYFYLLLASGYGSNVAWNVTPMPSMAVCKLTLEEVTKGIDYGSVPGPAGAKCIAVDSTAGQVTSD